MLFALVKLDRWNIPDQLSFGSMVVRNGVVYVGTQSGLFAFEASCEASCMPILASHACRCKELVCVTTRAR